eukprot:TRINITY_DN19137_c0_g1_i1.p2 TRINITY_DN19137_c0_g1~~TRINITY_DN19137_c0_g1_i1.p2  ORF type:complete len:129 (-),score=7.89 TRINITY_DN19137_c0_g1_i1:525-911(-)
MGSAEVWKLIISLCKKNIATLRVGWVYRPFSILLWSAKPHVVQPPARTSRTNVQRLWNNQNYLVYLKNNSYVCDTGVKMRAAKVHPVLMLTGIRCFACAVTLQGKIKRRSEIRPYLQKRVSGFSDAAY